MNVDVYKSGQIDIVLAILEQVQGLLEIEDPDVLFVMIEDAIDILVDD